MARFKQTVTQRSFVLGEMRADFLEGDDLEARGQSCRRAENVRVTASRNLSARPGSIYKRTLGLARDLVEVRPTTGLIFGLILNDTSLQICNATGAIVHTIASVPWTSGSDVWVETFREETIIGGSFGLYLLTYSAGSWSLTPFAFEDAPGGEKAQPYWAFVKDATILPSARTGTINVVASRAIWSPLYVGQRIRYGEREITITSYVSPTLVRGTVVSILPPSFRVTVASAANFRVGDAVIGQDTDFQGVIIAISGKNLDIVTKAFFDGPDVGEGISGPIGSAEVTAKSEIPPLASPIWDEALISPLRGYPRAAASASGRLTFIDFPLVPDLLCMSSVRNIKDFKVGASDDDAIVRQIGDNAPRFLHAVNAGDLLLFSDSGLYYVSIRDGGLLTPATFNAVLVDKRGASPVRPVQVDDGVVFVEASGEAIAVALLDGNIYLKWSVRTISTYHNHLIKSPSKLCGPSLFSALTEKYLFVVNGDGTLAAMSWFGDFNVESIGFVPWSTQGQYRSISPIFGGYWAIVDRTIDGTLLRFLEAMDNDTYLDCTLPVVLDVPLEVNGDSLIVNGDALIVSYSTSSVPFTNQEVHVYGGGWYLGTFETDVEGVIAEAVTFPAGSYAGFNFTASVMPWPVEHVQSPRAGMLKARLIRGSVSVLTTAAYSVRANRNTRRFGGYGFGDVLEDPPPLLTQVQKFTVVGVRDHPEIEIVKNEPGAFTVMAITQEVQG